MTRSAPPALRESTSQRTSYRCPAAGGADPARTPRIEDSGGSATSTRRLPWWVGAVGRQSAALVGCEVQAPSRAAAAASATAIARRVTVRLSLTGWVSGGLAGHEAAREASAGPRRGRGRDRLRARRELARHLSGHAARSLPGGDGRLGLRGSLAPHHPGPLSPQRRVRDGGAGPGGRVRV